MGAAASAPTNFVASAPSAVAADSADKLYVVESDLQSEVENESPSGDKQDGYYAQFKSGW